MKYKVGDRVRIINDEETVGIAKINDIAYITKIDESKVPYCCRIVGKDTIVWLCEEDITKKDYTWKDFEKCPIGTKVTFEDNIILVKSDEDRFDSESNCADYNYIESFNREDGFGKIIKIEEPTYTLVYEPNEVEEMTMEEVCKALGKQIKIVKSRESE